MDDSTTDSTPYKEDLTYIQAHKFYKLLHLPLNYVTLSIV
jgi:hypothetical protein